MPNKDQAANVARGIIRVRNWTEEGLADELGLRQSTINRWLSGKSSPTADHWQRLHQLFGETVRSRFVYVCSFAPEYSEELVESAMDSLEDTLLRTTFLLEDRPTRQRSLNLDLRFRAAKLPAGVAAHCFGNDHDNPTLFVILVNEEFSLYKQHTVAWDEAFAHVMRKRMEAARTVPVASPVIRKTNPNPRRTDR